MSATGTAVWKYDLRYYVDCFVRDMPRQHDLLRARTIDGAKEEAERRFPLRAPGDMLRILGVVRSGTYPRNHPVTVAETVFPKLEWAESDEAQWFRMAEGEAELVDGIVQRKKRRRIRPMQLQCIAASWGITERRLAEFVPDYGDVIAEIIRLKLITLSDAARFLDVSAARIRQLMAKGKFKFGALIRFPGRCFLCRSTVAAFAERRRRYREY